MAGEILGAVRAIDPRVPEIRGASRTDAGVHGHGQRVAFDPVLVQDDAVDGAVQSALRGADQGLMIAAL